MLKPSNLVKKGEGKNMTDKLDEVIFKGGI